MVEDRYSDFLKKVFEMTKSQTLTWNYLDKNKELCEGMKWCTTYSGITAILTDIDLHFNFNTDNSFFCMVDDTYIVLLVHGTKPADVYIVPNTFKNVVKFTAEYYGDIITRLLNLVRSQFPDAETFIDKFLKE